MPAAEHIERQIAVAIVIAVKEPALLMAVQRVVGRVEVENDLFGRPSVRLEEQVDEQGLDRRRVVADLLGSGWRLARQFQPVERRLAGDRRAILAPGLELARQHRHQRVVAKLVVIVQVLVAERDAEHALPDQRGDGVLDEPRVSRVAETFRFSIENDRPDSAFDDVGVELDAAVVEETDKPVPMVEAVAEVLGDRRLGGDASKLPLEPDLERFDQRLALLPAHAAPLLGARAAERLLDRIERGDAFERFAGDRRIAALGVVVEPSPQMRPAERERDGLVRRLGGDLLVGRVAVALHDAAIAVEQLQRMHRAAAGRVGEGDGGRIGPAPGSVVPGDRPEVAVLDPAAAGVEHRRLRLVDRDLAGAEDHLAQAQIERLEFGRGVSHPERQRPIA